MCSRDKRESMMVLLLWYSIVSVVLGLSFERYSSYNRFETV